MSVDYDTEKLFEFYNKNEKAKNYMDSHFSSDQPSDDYLPALNKLYKKHQRGKVLKFGGVGGVAAAAAYILL